jgi:tight adherence protein C
VSALYAALAVLLAFATAWELRGVLEGRFGTGVGSLVARLGAAPHGSRAEAVVRHRIPDRIARAGLDGRIDPGAVVAAKLACAAAGLLMSLVAAPVAPGRLAPMIWGVLAVAGFLGPDAMLERAARRRRERFVALLPEALDMLAVAAAAGRGPSVALGEIAAGSSGPLAEELGGAIAAIECGVSPQVALAALRQRVPGAEVGALVAALERSRRHGSPLAEQLHLLATSLRREARRRVEERAARAAPKIQLVVALILVPSVLLAIVAAILAHSDSLLAGF